MTTLDTVYLPSLSSMTDHCENPVPELVYAVAATLVPSGSWTLALTEVTKHQPKTPRDEAFQVEPGSKLVKLSWSQLA